MGWRTSFYSLKKGEDFYENKYGDDSKCECIFFDFCTDLWVEMMNSNEEFKKHIKCVHEDSDCDYYSIDKEGWRLFIMGIRDKHLNYLKSIVKEVDPDDTSLNRRRKTTYEDFYLDELYYWDTKWNEDNGIKFNFDEKHRFELNNSFTWEGAFYNAMALYKFFDWENNELFVFGG